MNAELCLLQDWEQAQELLTSLGLSRAQLKKYLSHKQLKRRLRARDELSLPLDLLNFHCISPLFIGEQPQILDEDDNFLILHKPANLHGHPLRYQEQDNVLSWLRSRGYGHLLEVGRETHERGLLYRLDQGTSGVLIYVKKHELWQELRHNFHRLTHTKRYLAVFDKRPTVSGELNAWFDLGGKKVKAHLDERSDCSLGHLTLKIIRDDERGCVALIDLTHGHRHQIRAHMAALGVPLRGDVLYGGSTAERLFLHAYQYEVLLTNGQRLIARDENLGFGGDFLDLHSNLEMLGDHGGIVHRR